MIPAPKNFPNASVGKILWPQLYAHAKYQARFIEKEVIKSEKTWNAVVKCVYNCGPLSPLTKIYIDFIALVNAHREHKKLFKSSGT